MANLFTQQQVRRRCVRHGFTRRQARIMSAIAMCEAPVEVNGVTYADCDLVGDQALANDKWGYSYSYFQVRSLREHKGTGQIRDELALRRPDFATKSALAIFKQQGFEAWSTYKNGAYKAYLQEKYPPPPNTHVVVSGDTLGGIAARYSTTWEELARINNIHSPYTIYIGQHIQLS